MNHIIFIHRVIANALALGCKLCLFACEYCCYLFSILKPCITLVILRHNIPVGIDFKFCSFQRAILIDKFPFLGIPSHQHLSVF